MARFGFDDRQIEEIARMVANATPVDILLEVMFSLFNPLIAVFSSIIAVLWYNPQFVNGSRISIVLFIIIMVTFYLSLFYVLWRYSENKNRVNFLTAVWRTFVDMIEPIVAVLLPFGSVVILESLYSGVSLITFIGLLVVIICVILLWILYKERRNETKKEKEILVRQVKQELISILNSFL
ncbi:MAG: hypothetical protein M1442_00230 [Candidatus Thermoplasmatota archaeon]|jgi:magnesium-transporting ATPase (P-type)|nr:hypothetical protein [Candidatus Thermoplasmatota archaeon]